jgi:hypothetical protein
MNDSVVTAPSTAELSDILARLAGPSPATSGAPRKQTEPNAPVADLIWPAA